MSVCIEFNCNQSNSYWDISLNTTNINLVGAGRLPLPISMLRSKLSLKRTRISGQKRARLLYSFLNHVISLLWPSLCLWRRFCNNSLCQRGHINHFSACFFSQAHKWVYASLSVIHFHNDSSMRRWNHRWLFWGSWGGNSPSVATFPCFLSSFSAWWLSGGPLRIPRCQFDTQSEDH